MGNGCAIANVGLLISLCHWPSLAFCDKRMLRHHEWEVGLPPASDFTSGTMSLLMPHTGAGTKSSGHSEPEC